MSVTVLWKRRKHWATEKILHFLGRPERWVPVVDYEANHYARQTREQHAKNDEQNAPALRFERHGCRFGHRNVRYALAVQGVRNARFFLLAEVEQVIFFIRFGGAKHVLLSNFLLVQSFTLFSLGANNPLVCCS